MISLLIINYRSAELALEAIRSARAATRSALQVVVVDNSIADGESESLRPHADILISPQTNLGYAGGINAGRPLCRGEFIVVSNPDVVFGSDSIDALIVAMREHDASVAGPALFWDDAYSWMLPPGELHSAWQKFDAALASRSGRWDARRDRRRIQERLRFWTLTTTTETSALSGAVMAIRAHDFDTVGGFDERFSLYFEENDFLRRMSSSGKRIVYVPSSRCRHLYNQSAGADAERAAAAYADSEQRYLTKWDGGEIARFVKVVGRARKPVDAEPLVGDIALPDGDFLIEASPLGSFDTAAGHFPKSREVGVPHEIWNTYRGKVLYLRVIDRATTKVVATYARYRS